MSQTPVEFFLPPPTLGSDTAAEQSLDIPYVQQTASQWCWATSAAMVTRFLFQNDIKICEVVSTLIPDHNCCSGAPPDDVPPAADGSGFIRATTPCNRTVKTTEVGQLYTKLGIQSKHRGQKIDFDTLCAQLIDSGSPIEVAFAWTGGGGHVALVRGVARDTRMVRINDPWPDTGEVLVPFEQLQNAYGRGLWFDCWTDIRKQDEAPAVGTI